MLRIEKNIPIPEVVPRLKRSTKPVFPVMCMMEIGDSILFAGEDFVERHILAARCSDLRSHHGINTITKREADGYRVWRVR